MPVSCLYPRLYFMYDERFLPEQRGFDSFFGFYAGSTDYYTQQSECWPSAWEDGCFESTNDGEPATGYDLRRGRPRPSYSWRSCT